MNMNMMMMMMTMMMMKNMNNETINCILRCHVTLHMLPIAV